MPSASALTPEPIQIGVLEDQQILRESLGLLLAASGFEVTLSCGSLEELDALLPSTRPHILLVDLRLRGDGAEATGWRAVEQVGRWYPEVRVVVISSSRDPADVARAQQARTAGFLPKDSLSSEQLITALRRVHAGEAVFPFGISFGASGDGALAEMAKARPTALDALTARELEALRYVAAGHDNSTIAACLGITERTVRAHVSALYRKLGSENRAQLALLARELGIRPPK